MPDGFVIRDAMPGDRDAVLSFWPHPDRFDRRLASSVSGEESFFVAVHAAPLPHSARSAGAPSTIPGDGVRPGAGRGGTQPVAPPEVRPDGSSPGARRAVRRDGAAAGLIAGIVGVRWRGGCDDVARPLLYALEVRPEQRGRGGGTALIRHVARRVAARGFAEISLEVEPGNAGAIRLYRRLGFVTAGPHRHVWYFGEISGSTDVLIMHGGTGRLAHA